MPRESASTAKGRAVRILVLCRIRHNTRILTITLFERVEQPTSTRNLLWWLKSHETTALERYWPRSETIGNQWVEIKRQSRKKCKR